LNVTPKCPNFRLKSLQRIGLGLFQVPSSADGLQLDLLNALALLTEFADIPDHEGAAALLL